MESIEKATRITQRNIDEINDKLHSQGLSLGQSGSGMFLGVGRRRLPIHRGSLSSESEREHPSGSSVDTDISLRHESGLNTNISLWNGDLKNNDYLFRINSRLPGSAGKLDLPHQDVTHFAHKLSHGQFGEMLEEHLDALNRKTDQITSTYKKSDYEAMREDRHDLGFNAERGFAITREDADTSPEKMHVYGYSMHYDPYGRAINGGIDRNINFDRKKG